MSPVYYRIMLTRELQFATVTLQWFDEYDYDQERFVTAHRFPEQRQAQEYADVLNAAIRYEWRTITLLRTLRAIFGEDEPTA